MDEEGGEVTRAGAPASRSSNELEAEMDELVCVVLAGVVVEDEGKPSERGGGGVGGMLEIDSGREDRARARGYRCPTARLGLLCEIQGSGCLWQDRVGSVGRKE